MNLLELVQRIIRRFGYDLVPFNVAQHHLARRSRLIEYCGIDTVLDIGANAGQFARELRLTGYRGRIVSFEPLGEAYSRLQAAARGDERWQVMNLALGDSAGEQTIHRAANSESSSLLEMLPLHADAAPYSHYTGTETIRVETLDNLFDEVCSGGRSIYMKVDTQGYEAHVLRGAAHSLDRIDTVQIEMSLAPLYEGQALMDELYALLTGIGFSLVGVENNFGDPRTGHLLQIDGIFRRDRAR
jgi:FkbM family methyltransferase